MTSTEITPNVEAPPMIKVYAIDADSMPPASSSLHIGELVSEPSTKREKEDDKKKKKK